MRTITYAPEAWKFLNGIFCIYKPVGITLQRVKYMLATNLARDLNELKVRPPKDFIQIEGSLKSGKSLSVVTRPSFSDHPLVVGPRYQVQDFQIDWASLLGKNTSGVAVMAINEGNHTLSKLKMGKHLRTYHIKGQFGYATDTFMADGKVIEKATYNHISHGKLDRTVSSIQCAHQTQAFNYAGVPLQSQAAYELASQGIIRPAGYSAVLLYGIRCIYFHPPNFTLEVHCINESELYLCQLVHEMGLYLKSCAVCVQLRQIRFGHFTLDHALLRKHWTAEHILNNIQLCKALVTEDKLIPTTAQFEKMDETMKPITLSSLNELE